jgi:hypothetical protein
LAARETSGGSHVIAGHFGFAAIVKSRERSAPLWALMLVTVWLDVVFTPLLLAHRETMQPIHEGYGGAIIHADYTHSIVGMLALSAALGVMFLPKLGRRIALVIALVSASHWVLDLVVHRADMPMLPGASATFHTSGWDCGIIRERRYVWNFSRCRRRGHVLARSDGASANAGKNGRLASLSAAMVMAFGLLVLFWITRVSGSLSPLGR